MAAELTRQGLPPVVGGSLDQTKAFMDACVFIWGEQRYWKAKLNPFAGIT